MEYISGAEYAAANANDALQAAKRLGVNTTKPLGPKLPKLRMEDLFTQLNRGVLDVNCKLCGATVRVAHGKHLEWHNALNTVLNKLLRSE